MGLELSTLQWLCRHISISTTDGPSAKKSFEVIMFDFLSSTCTLPLFLDPCNSRYNLQQSCSFQELNNSEVSGIISSAYMELLEWDYQNTYPETLKVSLPVYTIRYMNAVD